MEQEKGGAFDIGISRYYYSKLSDSEKNVYKQILKGLKEYKKEILTDSFTPEQIKKIIYALKYDNPQIFYWNSNQLKYAFNSHMGKVVVNYIYSTEETERLKRKIESAVNPILSAMNGMGEAEAVKYIHDRLVRRCTYKENEDRPKNAHNIIGPFIDNECVCEGYAMAFKFLADCFGLQSIVVTGLGTNPRGKSEGHAWNIVMIDGECYYLDITYDHLVAGSYCSNAYFLISEKELLHNHKLDETFKMPACNSTCNLLSRVGGTAELIEFLRDECKRNKRITEVRLTKGFSEGKDFFRMMESKLSMADKEWYCNIESVIYSEYCKTVMFCWK